MMSGIAIVVNGVIMLGFLLVVSLGKQQPEGSAGISFPAMIAFGDSILDTGNNNQLATIVKANFPPYGKDFTGHTPTGRFSNGKVPVDFLASWFGIKELLPAYLSPGLRNEDLLTGVCFACAASGYDPLTAKISNVISISGQLELFKDYKAKLQALTDMETFEKIISESLYVICTGNNDITNIYFGPTLRRAQYDLPAYVNFLVQQASSFIEDLYNLGARNIGIVGLPPLGCLPSQRTLAGGLQRDCEPQYNQAAKMFNFELLTKLPMLKRKLSNRKIFYIDIYEKLLHLVHHPLDYGFEVTTKACCGTGLLEVSILCNNLTSLTCTDDSKYIFWDSFHPTEKAYELISKEIMKDIYSALSA